MTDAERKLWRLLRDSFKDHHFRRQVPIRHYIADFVSHRAKLVIEVDGGQHTEDADAARTRVIEDEGYSVIRFWNHDVLGNADGVWSVIDATLRGNALPLGGGGLGKGESRAPLDVHDHPTPSPSPSRGGELG
jgi:very-short-patch-repair endonuclease